MNRQKSVVTLALILLAITAPHLAAQCASESGERVGTIDVTPTVNEVRDAHHYYMTSPDPSAGTTLAERQQKLAIKIKDIFTRTTEDRRTRYAAYRCSRNEIHTCTSSSGHTCDRSWIMQANPGQFWESMSLAGDGNIWMTPDKTQIGLHLRKSGRGRARGQMSGFSRYTDGNLNEAVVADVERLRQTLTRVGLPNDTTLPSDIRTDVIPEAPGH